MCCGVDMCVNGGTVRYGRLVRAKRMDGSSRIFFGIDFDCAMVLSLG